jgi:hypothetical protein
LANLDGYPLYLSEKDLAEYCEALCELEITYNNPENKGYFDFFMLYKNLFDAISFYVYGDGPITQIAEFYQFLFIYFSIRGQLINNDRLYRRMDDVLDTVREPLEKQNVFNSIDIMKARLAVPRVSERNKKEQHLKSATWWLGTTINIGLRTDLPKDHPIIRGMFDYVALMRKAVYGKEGIDNLKAPFNEFKKQWKNVSHTYKNKRSFSISPLLSNMESSLERVSKILKD